MKYKKHISIFLIFIVCTTFIYKPKKAQAFDFVVTPTILWTLGSLVLASGVVALNQDQILDMGNLVLDRYKKENSDDLTKIFKVINGVNVGVILTGGLLEVIDKVVSYFPTSNKVTHSGVMTSETSFIINDFVPHNQPQLAIPFSTIFIPDSSKLSKSPYMQWYKNGVLISSKNLGGESDYLHELIMTYTKDSQQAQIRYKGKSDIYYPLDHVGFRNGLNIGDVFTFKGYNGVEFGGVTTIPYANPTISNGYKQGLVYDELPFTDDKKGYVPIPNVIPDVGTFNPGLPLDWDSVKDVVKPIPLPDVGDIDIPGVGDIDIPGVGENDIPGELSLWEWLKNLLDSILNAIKSILSFLTSFLTNLLNGIKDLLLSLFIPSDTYFTDTFDKLKNQFSNKLSYNSYSDLFNRQYAASGIKDVTINWQGQTLVIVKFSEYTKFISFVNSVAYAFFFFLLAMYNYNQIYKLIRGTDLVSSGNTIGHMHGQLSAGEELRINNMEKSFKKLGR